MKTKVTILALLFVILSGVVFATTRTVSNHPLGGAQYNSLESAYNAAVNGDTLLIEGTNISYELGVNNCNTNSWAKSLIVIGAGYNSQKQNFYTTKITGSYYCQGGITNIDASNMKFYGITFVTVVRLSNNINNIIFEDCGFWSGFNTSDFNSNCSNIQFRNCIFEDDNARNVFLAETSTSTMSFNSCLFDGYIDSRNNINNYLLFDHCLFLKNNGDVLINIKNSSILNSIFMNQSSVANSGTIGCAFLNNIVRLAATLPPAGNSGSGNLTSTDPTFTNYSLGNLYSPSYDFHLLGGSPASGAATDATDIGLHGGTANFSEGIEPLVAPIMRSVQITNTTVAPNGTLNVNVSASKPADD